MGNATAAEPPLTSALVEIPPEHVVRVLGAADQFLRIVEAEFDATVHARGNELTVTGSEPDVRAIVRLFDELTSLARRGHALDESAIRQSIRMIRENVRERPSEVLTDEIIGHRGRRIRPKTIGQKRYLDAIAANTVTFSIGPAGTGKTYLAMGAAVRALKNGDVSRLLLTRPAVEAGERLGYLPGTLDEKIDPYLRPLWDALHEMIGADELVAQMQRGSIEVAPLAYMRGRTLNDAFVVLDEAQNTTPEQMKMFLTRIGFGSKAIVTGDISQIDLPNGRTSGLKIVREILTGIDGVGFAYLDAADVVRHPIVQRIVEAYDAWDSEQDRHAD
ncbi:MAG: PhoH family protein [Nitriliruptorales bacterium]|nr:PhoH family protein [Nitriliruptorales bacterium]